VNRAESETGGSSRRDSNSSAREPSESESLRGSLQTPAFEAESASAAAPAVANESKQPVAFRTVRRVEFRDTDAAGIVHFSAFFPMMESAEHEFLRSLGMSVMPSGDDPERLTWPRVAAACDYQGPARFEDLLQIDLTVDRVGRSSVTYRFQITTDGRSVATGRMTAVCCRLTAGGELSKVEVPASIRSRLLEATAS